MRIDEIISMAREAGLQASIEICGSVYRAVVPSNLERFAALVAAREREACALICDAEGREWDSDAVVTLKNYAKNNADLKAAIRARAEKEES